MGDVVDDFFIASVPKSHQVRMADSSSGPQCVFMTSSCKAPEVVALILPWLLLERQVH